MANEERYTGFGPSLMINAWKGMVAADMLDDIRNTLWTIAKDVKAAEVIFNEVGNVLLNIYVGTIANQVQARVDYHVPHLFIHEDKRKWAVELIGSHIPPQQLLLLKSSMFFYLILYHLLLLFELTHYNTG